MHRRYDDLLSLADRKPSFFQAGGVPRWARFNPETSTSPYASEAAIVEFGFRMTEGSPDGERAELGKIEAEQARFLAKGMQPQDFPVTYMSREREAGALSAAISPRERIFA